MHPLLYDLQHKHVQNPSDVSMEMTCIHMEDNQCAGDAKRLYFTRTPVKELALEALLYLAMEIDPSELHRGALRALVGSAGVYNSEWSSNFFLHLETYN